VPAPVKVTTPLALIEHTLDEVLSTLMVTMSPDEALALGVKVPTHRRGSRG